MVVAIPVARWEPAVPPEPANLGPDDEGRVYLEARRAAGRMRVDADLELPRRSVAVRAAIAFGDWPVAP